MRGNGERRRRPAQQPTAQQQLEAAQLAMSSLPLSPSSSVMRTGALFGFAAVALGAFGAHGLKNIISDQHLLKSWETAAHYQLVHSVMLCMCGTLGNQVSNRTSNLFSLGTILFSGSIYGLVLTRWKVLGPVTPIGGLLLLGGWASLGVDFM
ncbi:hypothetical protein PTSG_04543 [Salpingoeca rosetta]|uniref:DUF423-domain-containing protein n=1 Tax=Salpingoeca rosetta (strain ATCC 50818 / BSB-021) TaxID=946362 RepID=F2U7R1_SALR5|nr:uncharacterized protein PTSG_04543 [Salpingoeca rosetta]EGD72816.1 hypothetical protein PTSG_04543 [Salpingoeca rosetta]|eukprot:XP_004994639.1 hypothetical protein PTSG_04543 [Salpingoeca rosetta]